uniref:C-type lectin domain-containing protein n=1 Tax=Oryzias melastigma TaxID=30732 RepID=A0A3B3DYF2_ORYME
MTWAEARQHCRNEYTDLATVSSMADIDRLRKINSENKHVWIGLFNQTGTIAISHWSLPGLKFNESQAKWNDDEPNGGVAETCGAIEHITDEKWLDMSCMDKEHFLCYNGDKMTWFDAQKYCRKNHTDLISGPQLEETSVVNWNSLSSYKYIFIGLFRDAWTWSDGSSFSFRHWNLKYNNHVILINKSRTWEEALNYCRHHHHDLVTITNLDEQKWVQEKTEKALNYFVWTGLRYTCTLGFWFWVSDEVVCYKNWASPEQVNECDMSGAMERGGKHMWFKKHEK